MFFFFNSWHRISPILDFPMKSSLKNPSKRACEGGGGRGGWGGKGDEGAVRVMREGR